jgi:hypothetical protein
MTPILLLPSHRNALVPGRHDKLSPQAYLHSSPHYLLLQFESIQWFRSVALPFISRPVPQTDQTFS